MIANCLAVVIGTVLAFCGNSLVDSYWISYLPVLLWVAWLRPEVRLICIIIGSMLWASLLLQQTLDQRLHEDFDNRVVLLRGTITDISEQRNNSIRFYLEPDYIQSYHRRLPGKIRLSWYRGGQVPQAGERWQLQVKLRKPNGFSNPGAFDYERWLFVKGIAATGYVKKSGSNRRLREANWYSIDHYRLQIVKAIERACTDCRHQGLFKALTVGFRGDIPRDQDKLLRDSGTAHLLAISGLHIATVAALFYLLGGFLWHYFLYRTRFNRLECSALSAILAAVAYAALAGFSIPTVRALLMLMVVLLALMSRKSVNLLNSIAIAVSLILLVDPKAIGSMSFWLSITALLVIALGQFLLANQKNRLKQLIVIQVLFSLLFVPLSMLLFNQASPAGFLANIVAIPLLSFLILPVNLIASLLSVLDLPMATVLFSWLDHLTGWLLVYLDMLLTSGLQAFRSAEQPLLLLLCLAIALILMLLPLGWRARMPVLGLMPVALVWQSAGIATGDFRMTVLDVGMGTSVVVETRNHSLIYDFGPGKDNGFSAGEWVVKPYLQHRDIQRPDLMVISHVDSDHSGGFVSFTDEYALTQLLTGTPNELKKRFNLKDSVQNCHSYPAWRWDGVDFEFLSTSPQSVFQTSNNRSCVLKISGFNSMLLTGDIEAEQESRLLTELPEKLASDVLLAPHHGSLTSSSESFVNAVLPQTVVFTVGRFNRWGFPKPRVKARYQQIESRMLRTDQHGAITINSLRRSLVIKTHRQQKRIWHYRL